ncbi:hypothetical protein [Nitratireductor pacificus]|nr:hypothetical protein [Nitratireductor pacificus]
MPIFWKHDFERGGREHFRARMVVSLLRHEMIERLWRIGAVWSFPREA